MALVYVGIGFFYKEKIKELMENDSSKYDKITGAVAVLLGLFCYFNYSGEKPFYYFDMKPVYYKELFSAIVIPCAFGFVLVRIVYWISKARWLEVVQDFLSPCGRATVPIMFMHIPLNYWQKTIGYGRLAYVLIGVGVPVLFTLAFHRLSVVRRLFGLPDLSGI